MLMLLGRSPRRPALQMLGRQEPEAMHGRWRSSAGVMFTATEANPSLLSCLPSPFSTAYGLSLMGATGSAEAWFAVTRPQQHRAKEGGFGAGRQELPHCARSSAKSLHILSLQQTGEVGLLVLILK